MVFIENIGKMWYWGLEVTVPIATMAEASDEITDTMLSLISTVFDIFGGSTGNSKPLCG